MAGRLNEDGGSKQNESNHDDDDEKFDFINDVFFFGNFVALLHPHKNSCNFGEEFEERKSPLERVE